jgi:HEAT repeat protein
LATGLQVFRNPEDGKALAIAFDVQTIPKLLDRMSIDKSSSLTAATQFMNSMVLESTSEPVDLRLTFAYSDVEAAVDAKKHLVQSLETIGHLRGLPPAVGELAKSVQWSIEENRIIARLALPLDFVQSLLRSLRQERPEYWIAALSDNDARKRAEARRWLLARSNVTLPLLIRELRSEKSADVRRTVAEILGEMGEKAATAATALAAAVDDPNPSVRRAAVEALGTIGPKARDAALLPLLPILDDADADLAKAAQIALSQMDLARSKNANALVTALRQTGLGIKPRLYLLNTLAKMELEDQVVVPILVETLQGKTPALRQEAALLLGKLGRRSRQEVLFPLLEALKDEAKEVRSAAISALETLGKFHGSELPKLIAAYNNVNTPDDSRLALLRWMIDMGEDVDDSVFQTLLDARNRSDPEIRKLAVVALDRYSSKQGNVEANVPLLIDSLRNSRTKPEARLQAVHILGNAGPRAKDACQVLMGLLDDKSPEMRREVMAALERIGPPSKDLVPTLLSLYNPQSSKEARLYAVTNIPAAPIDSASSSRVLLQALNDSDNSVRRGAARSLVKLKPNTIEAVKAYEQALDDVDTDVRLQVATALAELPPETHSTSALLKAFADADDAIARKAVEGLARKGKPTKEDLPAYTEALRHKKERVRIVAVAALSELEGDALRALMEALHDTNPGVLVLALTALRNLGDEAGSALSEVEKLLKSDNDGVRLQAALFLLHLRRCAKESLPFALQAAVDTRNPEQQAARKILDEIGPWALDAADPLFDALRREETNRIAGSLLGKLGKSIVPRLKNVLADRDARVRLAAVEALGQIGPDSILALGDVNRLIRKDPDKNVQEAARKTSKKIRKID